MHFPRRQQCTASIARVALLILLLSLGGGVRAEIVKFQAIGSGRECDRCDPVTVTGRLRYNDPNPDQLNVLSLESLISLELEIPGGSRALRIPYEPPSARPDLGAALTMREVGEDTIDITLTAYSNFSLNGMDVSGADQWIVRQDAIIWDNGHGESFAGSLRWFAPEPTSLLLLVGGLALLRASLRRQSG